MTLLAQQFPNTGTTTGIQTNSAGTLPVGATNAGLSTQIIVKVNNTAVGALQRLTVTQNRPLERIKEIGTDGVIEIVPMGPTTFELTADRIVFDQLRLPEAFSRAFRFIDAQRIPFDIDIVDLSSVLVSGANLNANPAGVVVMTYRNCWFTSYTTPYTSDNYVITESSSLWCETAYLLQPNQNSLPNSGGPRGLVAQTDTANIEFAVNSGERLGTMDVTGLLNSVFNS